jgi:hypothetical protein
VEDQASEPAAKAAGGWGDWSASPSLRDGGWPVAAGNAGESQPVERTEDEDVRDQVRRAVEQLKAELGPSATSDYERPSVEEDAWEPEPAEPAAAVEPEMVVQEVPAWEASAPEGAAPEAAVPEAAVFEASAPPDSIVAEAADVDAPEAETAPQDEGDIREKVRRAVMEARAELGSGTVESDFATPAASPLEARIPHYEALLDKSFLSPACIVIEDPEGRVELVRVYRTLARLERAATANLANYSSHSVTIQMEERELPAQEDISDAVAYAFERSCKVDVDGNRANVLLTGSDTRAA